MSKKTLPLLNKGKRFLNCKWLNHDTIRAAIKGASKGSVYSSLMGYASGAVMTTVPVKTFFGLITIGSSTMVSAPALATFGSIGAVAGVVVNITCMRVNNNRLDREFRDLVASNKKFNKSSNVVLINKNKE